LKCGKGKEIGGINYFHTVLWQSLYPYPLETDADPKHFRKLFHGAAENAKNVCQEELDFLRLPIPVHRRIAAISYVALAHPAKHFIVGVSYCLLARSPITQPNVE
jgi:hypothetical protein